MNKKLYKLLCDNYNKEINVELYDIWKNELIDYDEVLVEQAIKQIISTDKYMPNLARIIEIIKEQPELDITEENKIKRWNKKNIHPDWLDKVYNEEYLSKDELEELEIEWSIFEN